MKDKRSGRDWIRARWQGDLVPCPSDVVDALRLDPLAAALLSELGLPREAAIGHADVTFRACADFAVSPRVAGFVEVGRAKEYGLELLVRQQDGGVFWWDAEDGGEPSFVNTSLEAALAFGAILELEWRVRLGPIAGSGHDTDSWDRQARRDARRLRREMKRLDAAALKDENGPWAFLLEEIGYGMHGVTNVE